MSFPRYPKYKDSGVEWLTTVPAHWEEVRGDAVIREKYESNKGMLSDNLLSLSFGRIVRKDVFSNDGLLPDSFETYQVVDPGDIVFRPTDLQNDWNSLRSAIAEERGIITSAYIAVTSSSAVPRYLHYLFRAYDHTKVFYSMGGGLRQAFKFADLRRLPLLMPPIPEQAAIASFLDRETSKTDALIAEQQRLIELLQEKRQAVISHAVTKGLNPDAPMKDSGIEWLGEVPEHWTVAKFGRIAFMQEGPGLRKWQFTDEGTLVICVTNITENGIDFSSFQKFISTEEYEEKYQHFTVEPGDILLSSSGNSWGKVAVYDDDEKVMLNTSTIRINSLEDGDATRDFLQIALQSIAIREQLGVAMTGSCQPNFGPTHLKTVMVALPPADEQAEIVEYVEERLESLSLLQSEAERAIKLLQERRSALISAAVTGQIDVRGLAGSEAA